MATVKQCICDFCRKEKGVTITLFDDRRLDGAGSMSSEYIYHDIGKNCLPKFLAFAFTKQPKLKAYKKEIYFLLNCKNNDELLQFKKQHFISGEYGVAHKLPENSTLSARFAVIDYFLYHKKDIRLSESFSAYFSRKLKDVHKKDYEVSARKISYGDSAIEFHL
jgi:hypothetical protein